MATSPSSPTREWEKLLAAIIAKPEAAVFLPPLLDHTHQYLCAIAPHEFSCLLDVQGALAAGKYATSAEFVTALRGVFLTALRYYGPRQLDIRANALKCLQEVDRLIEKTAALKGDYERTAGARWQPPEKAFDGARACRTALEQLLREHKDAVDMLFWAPEAYFDAPDESDYYDHVAMPASISDVSERLYNGQAVTGGVPVPPLVALVQGPHPPPSSYGAKTFPWEQPGASHYVMAPALASHPGIAYQPLFIYPGPFTSCAEFEADVCRVFDNAATYHEGGEDSELVPRARALRDAFKALLATHLSLAKSGRERAAGGGLGGSGLGSSGGPGGSSGGASSSSPANVAAAASSSSSSGGVFFGAGLASSSAAGSRATSPAPLGLMATDVGGSAAVAGYYGSSSGGARGVGSSSSSSSSSGGGGSGAGVSAPPSPPPVSRPPFVSPDQIYFGGLTKDTTESCLRVLAALQRVPTKVRKDILVCEFFMDAVNAVAFHDYYKRIKQPMWINKMIDKLRGGLYCSVEEVRADMALIKANCLQYNPPTKDNADIRSLAEYLHESFERLLGEEFRGDVPAGAGGGLTDAQVYGPSRSAAAAADSNHSYHRHHHHDATASSHQPGHGAGGAGGGGGGGGKKKDKHVHQHHEGPAAAGALGDAGDYGAGAVAPPAALATSKGASKKNTAGIAAPVPKHGKKATSKDSSSVVAAPMDSTAAQDAGPTEFSLSALHIPPASVAASGVGIADLSSTSTLTPSGGAPAASVSTAAAPRIKLKFNTSSAGRALGASAGPSVSAPLSAETPVVPSFAPAPAALLPLHSDDFPMAAVPGHTGDGLTLEDLLEAEPPVASSTHATAARPLPIDDDTIMTGRHEAHSGNDAAPVTVAPSNPPARQHASASLPVGVGDAPTPAAGGLGTSRLKLKLGGASTRTGSTPALPSASPIVGSGGDAGYGGAAHRAGTASTTSGGGDAAAGATGGGAGDVSEQPVLSWSTTTGRPAASAAGGAGLAGCVAVSTDHTTSTSTGAGAADAAGSGSTAVPPPKISIRMTSQSMKAAADNAALIDKTRDYTYFGTPEFQRTLRPTSLADLRLVPVGWPRPLDWLTAERFETFEVRNMRDNRMNVAHHFLLEVVKKAPGASLHLFETPFNVQNPSLYAQIPLAAEGNRTLSQVYEKLRYQLPKFRTSKETARSQALGQKGPPPDKPAILRTEEDAWITVQDMIDEIKAIFQTAIDIHTPSLLASDASSAAAGDASSSLVALWPGPELQRRDIVSRARHALEYIDMQTREYFADLVAASSTMRADREATRRNMLDFVSSHPITPATHKLLRTFVKKNFVSSSSNLRLLVQYFDAPVDVKWPTISSNYFARIKEPMDFGTLLHNVGVDLEHCKYSTHSDFHRHLMLIFENAIAFNAPKAGAAATATGGAASSSASAAADGSDKVSRAIYDAARELTMETEYMWPLYCFTLWDAMKTEGIETAYRRERQEEDRRKKEAADRTMRDLEAAAYATKSRETARPLLEMALAAALAGVPPPLVTEAPHTQYLAGVLGLEAGQRLHHYTREMQRLAAAQAEVEEDAAIAGMQWRDAVRAMQRSSAMQAAVTAAAAAAAAPAASADHAPVDAAGAAVLALGADHAPAASSAAAAADSVPATSGMKRPLSSASVGVLFGELADSEDDEGFPDSSGSTVSGADAEEEEEEEHEASEDARAGGRRAALPVVAPAASSSTSGAFVDVPSSGSSQLPSRPAVRVQVALQPPLRAGPPLAKRFKA